MSDTLHLKLPYLAPAQAQKHVTHNEALKRLDTVVQLAVLSTALTAPPAELEEGDRYIVAGSATGAWAGHEGEVAAFVDGAWDFADPEAGWIAFDLAAETVLVHAAGAWTPIGGFLGDVTELGINATADATNRLAVRSAAVLFSGIEASEGGSGDIRLILDKEADGDTASLLLQRGASGRAEIGLNGDADLTLKVSGDGSAWTEAIRIDHATGFPTIRYDNAGSGLSATNLQDAIDELAAEGGVDGDLTAIASLGGTGIAVRTGANSWEQRTVVGASGSGIAVANPGGVAGDITLDLARTPGYRNLLINPHGRINQRAPASNADDSYGHDRWYVLTQSGAIAVSTLPDVENGTPRMWRLTQSQASAQRMGYAQIIEGANCKHLRSRQATLSGRVRLSTSADIRVAVIEWTGAEDAVTSDVVNSWTNGSYTAGQFFISANVTIAGVAERAMTANTLADLAPLTVTLGSSFNNLIVFIWTEGAAAQNVTLDGALQLEEGAVATEREVRGVGVEVSLCKRYWQDIIMRFASGGGDTFTFGGGTYPLAASMRATPSITFTDLASNASKITTAAGGNNISISVGGFIPAPREILADFLTAGSMGNWWSAVLKLDAEL